MRKLMIWILLTTLTTSPGVLLDRSMLLMLLWLSNLSYLLFSSRYSGWNVCLHGFLPGLYPLSGCGLSHDSQQ